MNFKSPDEVRREQLEAMGPSLGPIFQVLYDDVVWLHATWLGYQKLFGEQANIDVLNGTAPFFFRVVQRAMWERLLLGLARLFDPRESGRKRNLSFAILADAIQDVTVAADVRTEVEKAKSRSDFAIDWRRRRIGHRDHALALDDAAEPLKPASRANVEAALEGTRLVMNRVHRHYVHTDVGFEYFIAPGGDADALLYYLRKGMSR